MLSCNVDSGIRKVADRYKSVFEGELGYAELCAFLSMSLYGCKGLSELVRYCPWTSSVSELSRAIDGWNTNRFMRRLRASVLNRLNKDGNMENWCYAIDDTANPKYGKGIFGVGHWHNAAGPFFGQKILVIALINMRSGVALPIHFAFARKDDDPQYKSLPLLAADLMEECVAVGFPRLPVTSDSWFDAAPMMNKLEEIGLTYAGEIKATRNVRNGSGKYVKDKKIGKYLGTKELQPIPAKPFGDRGKHRKKKRGRKKLKFMAEAVVMINGVSHPVKVIAVYNRRFEKDAFAFYLSTERTMSGAKLWALSRSRWLIECLFRDLKQNLGFGRLPCRGAHAADLAVCVPFALLISLQLDPPGMWGLKAESEDTLGTKVAKIRERNLDKSIHLITQNPDHPMVIRLRARRRQERIGQKPDQKPAGERKAG
jgi:hypothetical protein